MLSKFTQQQTNHGNLLKTLSSNKIKKIIHFVLGPEGTNIERAAHEWTTQNNLQNKTEFVLCETPEKSLEQAKECCDDGVLSVFWTCAVYSKLNDLFFNNPDVFPFFIQHTTLLDKIQLATTDDNLLLMEKYIKIGWTIASHSSPAPLLEGKNIQVFLANNSFHSAELCSKGEVDGCITTETACQYYGLKTVHIFGSPPMVFFGGITTKGIELVNSV